ncbi:MAG: hypothetical protein K2Y01_09625 [Rhabdochlamydiaceae bacterium]|nr:hypothetical protein [Rhabdochlamydiaceae bacterium]
MKHAKFFYIITCASCLIYSKVCATSPLSPSKNIGPGSRSTSSQDSLEGSLHMGSQAKSFAPNSLFYPPTHSANPMTSLQNEAFLHNSFHWSYFRSPNGQLWGRNSYGDQLLLDP